MPHPAPALFDVLPFLERMINLALHQSIKEHITINLIDVNSELMLYADEQLLGQVVINILNNAVQAIEKQKEGIINIRAYCDEYESVIIEIANNGPRITSETANQIFIPFFTTKENGSGIGLSISKQIMRLIGGTLTLLPYKNETQLTTFVLKIA